MGMLEMLMLDLLVLERVLGEEEELREREGRRDV